MKPNIVTLIRDKNFIDADTAIHESLQAKSIIVLEERKLEVAGVLLEKKEEDCGCQHEETEETTEEE